MQTAPVITCPKPLFYSKGFQQQWAVEVAATPTGSTFRKVTDDYLAERAKLRLCSRQVSP